MRKIFIYVALTVLSSAQAQVQLLTPTSPDMVIEKLGPRLTKVNANGDATAAVRQAISLARQTADPRYLGQAQALIGKNWSNSLASHDLLTLQATIEQSRHEFTQAAQTLQLALQRPAPSKAQAYLTLATLERVQGNYAAALKACASITEPPAQLYARACTLETQSMQGQWVSAREGFSELLRQPRFPVQQSWLLSLQAENELRAGERAAALKMFAASLALQDDSYTALAYADALLDANQAQSALDALKTQPASDSVLIRRARAYKQLGDQQHTSLAAEIDQRLAAMAQRGSMLGHAREMALFQWYVKGNAGAAWMAAQDNLKIQRESVDWQIALLSAQATGQSTAKSRLLEQIAKTGLKDTRLQ